MSDFISKYNGVQLEENLDLSVHSNRATLDKIKNSGSAIEYFDGTGNYSSLTNICNQINTLNNIVSLGSEQTKNLFYGMNRIKVDVPVSPKIQFSGRTYINLLGKMGNCENLYNWNNYQVNLDLDTNNKVFENNSIKMTISTGSYGSLKNEYYSLFSLMNSNKYYMLSLYIKNGNSSSGVKASFYTNGIGSTVINTPIVTNNTVFTRVLAKLKPSDWGTGSSAAIIEITIYGSSNQYCYIDGIMVNEISSTDYNLSDDDLLNKYQYFDSYAALTNPYFENRRGNLVINGNGEFGTGYWSDPNKNNKIDIVNGKIQVTSTIDITGVSQIITVNPNTNYYISGNLGDNSLLHIIANGINLRNDPGPFNTGTNTSIMVSLINQHKGIGTYDSIMLIEGITAPTKYISCDLQRFVIEEQFTNDDNIIINNGEISGQLLWKHKILFGRDYIFRFINSFTGFKNVALPITVLPNAMTGLVNNYCIKYNGNILKETTNNISDTFLLDSDYFYLSIPNSDSGWNENISPNGDEISAFMNGWKAVCYNTNNRCIAWINIVDDSVPMGIKSTILTIAYSANETSIIVKNASIFTVGEHIAIEFDNGEYKLKTITSILENTITLDTSEALTAGIGRKVMQTDGVSTNGGTVLSWCKSNIAPKYEGYKLHYKLINPEPVTSSNIHVKGHIWNLQKGDNYITINSGIVLNEIVKPIYYTSLNSYAINIIDNLFENIFGNQLKNKAEHIDSIYKNGMLDSKWLINYADLYAYGKARASISTLDYDSTSKYTIDYSILNINHIKSFSSLQLSYSESVISALNNINEIMESKQNNDIILDNIVDSSIYEIIDSPSPKFLSWFDDSTTYLYAGMFIPFKVVKKVPPVIKILKYNVITALGDITKSAPIFVNANTYGLTFEIRILLTDTSIITKIKTNGISITNLKIEADCRGRL